MRCRGAHCRIEERNLQLVVLMRAALAPPELREGASACGGRGAPPQFGCSSGGRQWWVTGEACRCGFLHRTSGRPRRVWRSSMLSSRDLTAFARFDDLGPEVTGQRLWAARPRDEGGSQEGHRAVEASDSLMRLLSGLTIRLPARPRPATPKTYRRFTASLPCTVPPSRMVLSTLPRSYRSSCIVLPYLAHERVRRGMGRR